MVVADAKVPLFKDHFWSFQMKIKFRRKITRQAASDYRTLISSGLFPDVQLRSSFWLLQIFFDSTIPLDNTRISIQGLHYVFTGISSNERVLVYSKKVLTEDITSIKACPLHDVFINFQVKIMSIVKVITQLSSRLQYDAQHRNEMG